MHASSHFGMRHDEPVIAPNYGHSHQKSIGHVQCESTYARDQSLFGWTMSTCKTSILAPVLKKFMFLPHDLPTLPTMHSG